MRKLLFLIFLVPTACLADRLGSLTPNSNVLLSTQAVGTTNYIQNTLTPTTTTQVFNVAYGVINATGTNSGLDVIEGNNDTGYITRTMSNNLGQIIYENWKAILHSGDQEFSVGKGAMTTTSQSLSHGFQFGTDGSVNIFTGSAVRFAVDSSGNSALGTSPTTESNKVLTISARSTTDTPLKFYGYLTNGTYTGDLMQWRDKDGRTGRINYRGALMTSNTGECTDQINNQDVDLCTQGYAFLSLMRFSGNDAANNNILARSGQSIGISIADGQNKEIIFRTETRKLAGITDGGTGQLPRVITYGQCGTAANNPVFEYDPVWSDSTLATRKARITFGLHDFNTVVGSPRVFLQADTDGTAISTVAISGKLTANFDANVAGSTLAWRDQALWTNASFILYATTNAYYTTTSTNPYYGRPQFSASASTATNGVFLEGVAPNDFDQSLSMSMVISDFQGGVDASSRTYIVSIASVPHGGDPTALTFSNPITITITNATGGGGRIGISAETTLTGWNTYLTAAAHYVIAIRRQGDSTPLDPSTTTSYFDKTLLYYGRRQ